jgi:Ca2+-binding EF-hand superfamily protein
MPFVDFDGKPASFVPGKEKPNKEPAVSKFVVEKLYKVHRERIRDMSPIVDCHFEVPEFMNNQSWKKITEEHRKEVIRMENEVIYQRIAKMENSESLMTKESRHHKKRVENELKLMKSLKLKGRIRDFLKLQRENEDMLRRIERARPQYSKKNCKEWYRHHELFKQGRRSDPTGGHLGFTTLKGLLPKKLDRQKKTNLDLAMDASVIMNNNSMVGGEGSIASVDSARPHTSHVNNYSRGNLPGGKKARGKHLAATGSIVNNEGNKYAQGILNKRYSRAKTAGAYSSVESQNSMFDLDETKALGGVPGNLGSDGTSPAVRPQSESSKSGGRGSTKRHNSKKTPTSPIQASNKSPSPSKKGKPLSAKKQGGVQFSDIPHTDGLQDVAAAQIDGATLHTENSIESLYSTGGSATEFDANGMLLLLSRGFSIPFQAAGCTIRIFCEKIAVGNDAKFSESFTIQAVTNTLPKILLAQRVVGIDEVYNIINSDSSHNKINAVADGGDLVSLRSLLVNMFKDADDDGNGYLTYDEFEVLMEKVELGIDSSDLRYVIQEADENENGVVEFDEFVPLAVDMIQSFRALNKAKIFCSHLDATYEEEVRSSMNLMDFDKMISICMDKLNEHDPKRYGVMRVAELKRCLNSVAQYASLSETTINMIIHKLPSDNFGRLLYNGIGAILKKVKFIELKNELVQAQATILQKSLYNACRRTEIMRNDDPAQSEYGDSGAIGILREKELSNILTNSDANLSRLQICVLMVAGKDTNGDVDYVQFLPVASKAIEYMFEPKALRQRAELIEKTDLSSENLLSAITEDDMDSLANKFRGLFESCDVNHSGLMNLEEFILCMKALDLHLTEDELEAYFASIPAQIIPDEEGDLVPEITFADAVDFLRTNLRSMERKKQNRILAAKLHQDTDVHGDEKTRNRVHADLEKCLLDIFKLGDEDSTGFLTNEEMNRMIQSLNLGLSDYELEFILAEADRMDGDEDGLIDYTLFLPVCVDLVMTYMKRKAEDKLEGENLEVAKQQAGKIVSASKDEIMQIASYLRTRLIVIDEGVRGESNRFNALSEMLHDFHSGLTNQEAVAIHDHFVAEGRAAATAAGKGAADDGSPNAAGSTPSSQPGTPSPMRKSMRGAESNLKSTKGALRSKKLSKLVRAASSYLPTKVSLKKSLTELIELITNVRRTAIMRSIVKQLNPASCAQLILNKIEELREEQIEEGKLEKNTIFVPVRLCYRALHELQELRLSQPQISAVISWADCFDSSGLDLDFQRFSEQAAKSISNLFNPVELELRGKILTELGQDESYMNGVTKENFETYLRESLEDDHVSITTFIALLTGFHALNISKNEAVVASASQQYDVNDNITAESVLELTYGIVRHICRQRHINRRMALQAAVDGKNDEAKNSLSALASQFADFIKIRRHETNRAKSIVPVSGLGLGTVSPEQDKLMIYIPTDRTYDARDVSQEENHLDAIEDDEALGLSDEEELLFEEPATLAVAQNQSSRVAIKMVDSGKNSRMGMQQSHKPVAPPHLQKDSTFPKEIKGQLKVVAVEKANSMDRDLVITLTSSDGKSFTTKDSVKLPMLCSVDRDLAEEFARSLRDRISIEVDMDNHATLVMGELEEEDVEDRNFGDFFE